MTEINNVTFSYLKRTSKSFYVNFWPILVVFSISTFVLLWKLGQGSLEDWDEAIYAQISKNIVHGKDWITLHYQGYGDWEKSQNKYYNPWFEKPPLFMWATAFLFSLFGIDEFWARATSAFSGIGMIILTYLIGKLLYSKYVGFSAALILLSNYPFIRQARFGTTDIMLTFFIFLAIYAYLYLERGHQKMWYIIWMSFALAFMVKGFASFVIPTGIIISISADRKIFSTMRLRSFWLGFILALFIVLPWHIVMIIQHGKQFIDQYFGYHIFKRATTAIEGHGGDYSYYFAVLRDSFIPWVYLLPFTIGLSIKENIKSKSKSRIILVMLLVVFGLYTVITKTKLSWYITPVYPALSILIASMIHEAFKFWKSIAFFGLFFGGLIALMASKNIVLLYIFLGSIAVFLLLVFTRNFAHNILVYTMCAPLILIGIQNSKSLYYKREEPIAQLARIAGSRASIYREPLIIASLSNDLYAPTPLFYSNRPIQAIYQLHELKDLTDNNQRRDIILRKEDIKSYNLLIDYEIHILSEAEPLVYATLQRRGS